MPPEVSATKATEVVNPSKTLIESINSFAATQADLVKTVKELAKPTPAAAQGPFIRTGEDPNTSRGFSFQKLGAFIGGHLHSDNVKVELDMHSRLSKLYQDAGYRRGFGNSVMVPFASDLLAVQLGDERLATECRQVMGASVHGSNPEEVRNLRLKHWGVEKAMSWQDDANLGALVGMPVFGELVTILRNNEVLMQAGARQMPMPPHGRLTLPRQTGASTAYWVGESSAITDSHPTTGDITLQAKKLGVLSKIPNELFRFAAVSVEQFIRDDIARVMSLKMDKTLLEDVGSSTTPKGLINYASIGTHTASTTGTDGDTFSPEDVAKLVAKVENVNAIFKAFIMRPLLWAGIVNRRSDAITAGDGKGGFVFNVWRELQDSFSLERQMPGNLSGYPVFKSTQLANNRAKGSSTALSYVLGGDFNDYLIALSGVMEFQMSNSGDTPLTNDQTWLRGILYCDAAPLREASFILCDSLVEG